MKSTIFLAFFFLFFVFSTTLPSTTADFVFDTDGDPHANGLQSYHIIPAFKLRGGGGLELTTTGNETCPLTVVQAPSERNPGLPAIFVHPPSRILIFNIFEDTFLGISFRRLPNCVDPESSEWDVLEEFPIGWSVKQENIESPVFPFKIEKFGQRSYKLVYCPGAGEVCGDLGINHDKRLIVKDGIPPFIVQFKKAILNSAN